MTNQLRLPVVIEDFKEIREKGYYYVDKTALIEQVLEEGSKVTLFTRPRRFGKSLNMSMLQRFFEIGTDSVLFDGLHIAQNAELCDMHMGKYPVIAISLKGMDADSYEKAKSQLVKIINKEARRYRFLLEGNRMDPIDKDLFTQLLSRQMDEDTITGSLQDFTELLENYFSQKVVVLIDKYDVPLAKVYENGEVVDGIGGGICQISSTLYNSVLMANLDIVERKNHQFVTSYTPAGRDATVVYGMTDFKFKNTRKYAIKIKASASNGVATVSIYGIKEENEYTVSFSTRTVSTIPFTVKYVDDNTLAVGTEKVKQKGANGIITETYITKSLNGKVVSTKLLSKDTYNAMQRIILRGTKGAATSSSTDNNQTGTTTPSAPVQDNSNSQQPSDSSNNQQQPSNNNSENTGSTGEINNTNT